MFVKRINIRSTDQISDTGERWIVYPVISNSSVTGLVAGILNKEETTVEFRNLKPGNEYYDQLIPLFREQFQKSLISARQLNRNGKCGHINQPPCEIDVIIITPPNPGGGGGIGIGIGGGGGEGTPKPCSKYENCIDNNPGGGGGSGGIGAPPIDPCEKMKIQNSTESFKNKISELDKKEVFNKEEETGFAAAYGTTPFEPLANTDNDNLKFPPGNKYFGYIHTHLDSKEGVIKIFSPADIATFLTTCVRNAQEKGNVTDAYGMVITSQGNYILKYSGDSSYGIGPVTLENWNTWYTNAYEDLSLNDLAKPEIVEKLFAQFLKEKVRINGLDLYKSDKTTGNTSKLEYDGQDKPVKPIPCP